MVRTKPVAKWEEGRVANKEKQRNNSFRKTNMEAKGRKFTGGAINLAARP